MQNLAAATGQDWRYVGLDLVPAQIAVLDRDGNIRYVNAAWDTFARTNGYRGPGFVGANYLDVCDSACGAERNDARAFADGLRGVLDGTADRFALSYPCHAPDRERWYKAVVERHDDVIVVSHTDITAEYSNAARMTDPVWNRATLHEMKTPLNSIQGFAELARDDLTHGRGHVDVGDCLTTIREAAGRLLQVVNDVLRNPDSGGVGEEDIPVALVLDEIRARHRGAAVYRGVEIRTHADADPTVRADPDHLTKILDNLVSNAIKYSPNGGTVDVMAWLNAANGIEIAVTDTGIGMDPARVGQIFNPYVRLAEDATVAEREGSGLGLAVARNLMHVHGGDIRVDTAPGAGSRFTLAFPTWRTMGGGRT